MYLDRRTQPGSTVQLLRRQMDGKEIFWVTALSLFGAFSLLLMYVCFRDRLIRRRRKQNPQESESEVKPSIFSIARWKGRKSSDLEDGNSTRETTASSRPSESTTRETGRRSRGARVRISMPAPTRTNNPATAETSTPTSTVDRRTSVRSVMTLPVYRPDALATERVLGREGDRDGVDVVIEQPTAEQDEEMREEEMDALYQIRLFRRQQIAERDERRRLRREARDRNDIVALEEIRTRTRADTSNVMLEGLRAEHERIKETRKRSASSVSYHDVGIARHDGTRLRANSTESERCGLLTDAASIFRDGESLRHHRRDRSASSVFSVDSDVVSQRSRAGSTAGDTPRIGVITTPLGSPSPDGRARAGSSPEMVEADIGDSPPPNSPPGYEEISLDDARSEVTAPYGEPPPDYTGPHGVESISSPASERSAASGGNGNTEASASDSRNRLRVSIGHVPQIVVEPSSAEVEGRGRMW